MSKLTLIFRGKVLKIFPVIQGEMLIGSDPECTIHIDSLAVQPRHASVTTSGDITVLRDLGTADGTFINNKRIEEHELKDGELIRVGKHNLSYAYEAVVSPPAEEQRPPAIPEVEEEEQEETDEPMPAEHKTGVLQFLSGSNLGRTISLQRNMTNIGKPGVQLAVITRRSDGYYIAHLEGQLPTLVGKTPLGDDRHLLQDGDIIVMGNVKMQFFLE